MALSCSIIGHSHIITEHGDCARCGHHHPWELDQCVMLHGSGFWCQHCEDVMHLINLRDSLWLPPLILTQYQNMRPRAMRPHNIGGLA